jgi:hypothetical protein
MSGGVWVKGSPSWGSAERVQRAAYAYAVAVVMAGRAWTCPACLGPLAPGDNGAAEVDRVSRETDSQGREVYRPGCVVMVCRRCNQDRSELQARGSDWTHADQYAQDVADASALVDMPTVRESREWWQDVRGMRADAPVSRYA